MPQGRAGNSTVSRLVAAAWEEMPLRVHAADVAEPGSPGGLMPQLSLCQEHHRHLWRSSQLLSPRTVDCAVCGCLVLGMQHVQG